MLLAKLLADKSIFMRHNIFPEFLTKCKGDESRKMVIESSLIYEESWSEEDSEARRYSA